MTENLDEQTLALLVVAVAHTFLPEHKRQPGDTKIVAHERATPLMENRWKWSYHFPIMPSIWKPAGQARKL